MTDDLRPRLRALAEELRQEEQRLHRMADWNRRMKDWHGQTQYAERLAARADGFGTAAKRIDALLLATEPSAEPAVMRTLEDSGLCCLSAHATATPPWTCSCRCHTKEYE